VMLRDDVNGKIVSMAVLSSDALLFASARHALFRILYCLCDEAHDARCGLLRGQDRIHLLHSCRTVHPIRLLPLTR
jgi:hypothetical protein